MQELDSKTILEDNMKQNTGVFTSCKRQEVLEFNDCYVGLQHLYMPGLLHRLIIIAIDKQYSSHQLSYLQRTYLQTHYKDKYCKVILNEAFYFENKLLQAYEKERNNIIALYSELKQPILDIRNELLMLEQNQLFNLCSLNIKDQNKVHSSYEQFDLTQSVIFNQEMNELARDNDTKLGSYIAIQSQILYLKVHLLKITIAQYWMLQIKEIKKRSDESREEEIITKNLKDIWYFIIINDTKCKIQLSRSQIELFISLLHYKQYEQFMNQQAVFLKNFTQLEMQQPSSVLTTKCQFFSFRDCKFCIVEKLNYDFNSILYSLEILGIEDQYYSVIETQNINEIFFRLQGFPQLNISAIIQDPEIFYKYFRLEKKHNINPDTDPSIISERLKMGSIILSDRSVFYHAALYLGCDLVFHYSDENNINSDKIVEGVFRPDKFENFMSEAKCLTEHQFIFILRDRLELMDKALLRCKEDVKYDLTKNNCEHLVFEVLTNFKYSSQIDQSFMKSLGATVAKYFGFSGSSQSKQHRQLKQ